MTDIPKFLSGSRAVSTECSDGGLLVLYERDGEIRRAKFIGDRVEHIDEPLSQVPEGVSEAHHARALDVLRSPARTRITWEQAGGGDESSPRGFADAMRSLVR